MTIEIDASIFNPVYRLFLNQSNQINIFYGGAGSGKSYFITQRTILDVLAGGRNYLVIRKVAKTLRQSVFEVFIKIIQEWNLSKLFTINKSNFTITCKNGYKIVCIGLDDPEKVKSIAVSKGNITDIWIEEATELQEQEFNQLLLRMRGSSSKEKRIWITFNPINETHWLKKRFFDNQDSKTTILKTTYKDNIKNLSQDDIDCIESFKKTDQLYYNVYALGEWGQLNNNDTIIKLETYLKWVNNKKDLNGQYVCGVDVARFGDDKTVFFLRKGTTYIAHEVYKKKSIDELARRLKSFVNVDRDMNIRIDDTGVGGGLTDIMAAANYNVTAINFGSAARNPNKYSNFISEIWFNTAVMEDISIPDIKELKDELLARRMRLDEKGRRNIESKADFKKRFGRSPDYADAFLICFSGYQERDLAIFSGDGIESIKI